MFKSIICIWFFSLNISYTLWWFPYLRKTTPVLVFWILFWINGLIDACDFNNIHWSLSFSLPGLLPIFLLLLPLKKNEKFIIACVLQSSARQYRDTEWLPYLLISSILTAKAVLRIECMWKSTGDQVQMQTDSADRDRAQESVFLEGSHWNSVLVDHGMHPGKQGLTVGILFIHLYFANPHWFCIYDRRCINKWMLTWISLSVGW